MSPECFEAEGISLTFATQCLFDVVHCLSKLKWFNWISLTKTPVVQWNNHRLHAWLPRGLHKTSPGSQQITVKGRRSGSRPWTGSFCVCRKCPAPGPALQTLLPGSLLFCRRRSLFPFSASVRSADAKPLLLQRGDSKGSVHVLWFWGWNRGCLNGRWLATSTSPLELQYVDFCRTLHQLQCSDNGNCPLPAFPCSLYCHHHDAAAPVHHGSGLTATK